MPTAKTAAVLWQITCLLGVAAGACQAQEPTPDRWSFPAAGTPAPMPKLTMPLRLDGDLAEWESAVRFFIGAKSDIAWILPSHTWNGAADANLELACAWNEEGLCLAAVVADDEVINTQDDANLYKQDGLELFVDGRAPDKLMTPPYSRGAYQLFVRPPQPDQPPRLVAHPAHGEVAGLKSAGQRTATGSADNYTVNFAVN